MSFNIGLSGLQATSEQMNTISHNIANGSTAGFKSSRTEFQDVYAATFGGGQANGVAVSNIRQSFATGSMTTTGRNADLAINGDGFLWWRITVRSFIPAPGFSIPVRTRITQAC